MHGSDALLAPIVDGVADARRRRHAARAEVAIEQRRSHAVRVRDRRHRRLGARDRARPRAHVDGPPARGPDRIQFDQQLQLRCAPGRRAHRAHAALPNRTAGRSVGRPNTDKTAPDASKCLDPDHELENPGAAARSFLAVAPTDGTVRIVDVHDMELLDASRSPRTPLPRVSEAARSQPCPQSRNARRSTSSSTRTKTCRFR